MIRNMALGLSAVLLAVSVAVPMRSSAQGSPTPKGKVLFLRCAACHAIGGNVTKVGPNLQSVVGRRAGSLAGFNYSPAMKSQKFVWDAASLDRWLTRPSALVPGTTMAFAGLSRAEDRQALIAYLKKPTP